PLHFHLLVLFLLFRPRAERADKFRGATEENLRAPILSPSDPKIPNFLNSR
ncbi:unnamed protein product, partial [Linum tenue]